MEIALALAAIVAIVSVAVFGGLRSTRAAGWSAFEARHRASTPLQGPSFRLPLCWVGTRFMPYSNCIRAHLSEAGIGLHGIGAFGWFHRPLLMPWTCARGLRDVGMLGVDRYELLLDDGVGEMGLTFVADALPALARHGVVLEPAAHE